MRQLGLTRPAPCAGSICSQMLLQAPSVPTPPLPQQQQEQPASMEEQDVGTGPHTLQSQALSKLPRRQSLHTAPPCPPQCCRGPAHAPGLLCEHLGELLDAGDQVLPFLPPEIKASLLAIARLRRLLSDAALLLLADAGQPALDLGGCDYLGERAILVALQRMPDLRWCDLRGCDVGPAVLRALGSACPALELLRLGGAATDAAPGMGAALKAVLPGLDKRPAGAAAESWEDAAEGWDAPTPPPLLATPGRLMDLRCLHWPGIRWSLERHMASACPAVMLNPTSEQVAAAGLPLELGLDAPLDAAALAAVARWGRWRYECAGEQQQREQEPVMHIADRFMNAYISRERRLRLVRERQDKAERKRRERAKSAAEQEAEAWETAL